MIQQSLKVQLVAAGGAADQVVEPLPTEDLAVEQHLLEAVAQLRIGVLHQPAGEVGIGRTQDLEVGVDAQGDALQRHQGANDQGVIGRDTEGEAIHHPAEVVGDGLEVHPAHTHLQGLAKDLFKGRNDGLEIHVFRQEAQADEVVAELSEVAVHQVNNRLDQPGAALTADLAHHPEVQIGQAAIG